MIPTSTQSSLKIIMCCVALVAALLTYALNCHRHLDRSKIQLRDIRVEHQRAQRASLILKDDLAGSWSGHDILSQNLVSLQLRLSDYLDNYFSQTGTGWQFDYEQSVIPNQNNTVDWGQQSLVRLSMNARFAKSSQWLEFIHALTVFIGAWPIYTPSCHLERLPNSTLSSNCTVDIVHVSVEVQR